MTNITLPFLLPSESNPKTKSDAHLFKSCRNGVVHLLVVSLGSWLTDPGSSSGRGAVRTSYLGLGALELVVSVWADADDGLLGLTVEEQEGNGGSGETGSGPPEHLVGTSDTRGAMVRRL